MRLLSLLYQDVVVATELIQNHAEVSVKDLAETWNNLDDPRGRKNPTLLFQLYQAVVRRCTAIELCSLLEQINRQQTREVESLYCNAVQKTFTEEEFKMLALVISKKWATNQPKRLKLMEKARNCVSYPAFWELFTLLYSK